MNYGKIAYLKTLDLEQRLANVKTNAADSFVCSEFSYDTYNQSFTLEHNIDYDGLKMAGQSVCLQSKIVIESTTAEVVTISVIAAGQEIGAFDQKLLVGTNDVLVYKTYSEENAREIDFEIKITATSGAQKVIKSVNTIFFGIASMYSSSEIELRAIMVGNGVCVSYINGNKLFVSNSSSSELEFNLVMEAVSHSIINRELENSQKLQIFYVNNEKELRFCDFGSNNSILIDTGVTKVFAVNAPKMSDDEVLVCYIKNGVPTYKTIVGNTMLPARQLPYPSGRYVDIRIVTAGDEYLYVLATNESGANFIIKSVMEISTGKFVENISLDVGVVAYKYFHMPLLEEGLCENISVSASYFASSYFSYAGLGDKPFVEHIGASCEINASAYEVIPEVTDIPVVYGIEIDFNNSNPETSVTYTDDAASFSGAYMDFNSDVFVDNGWLGRWPFNQIKPCLVSKTGDVIGYLDPNDYSKFEDGTSADIYTVGTNDVMIEIPRVDYHLENIDETHVSVKITNKRELGYCTRAHTYKGEVYDKIYVAAYASRWLENANINIPYLPYSVSGTPDRAAYLPSANLTSPNMMLYTREKMYGYEHCPVSVHVLLQCLYLIMFKNLNSQSALGKGVVAESTLRDTGMLDKAGMYYGKNVSYPIKMFGIENIYGNGSLYLPGMYTTSKYAVYALDPMKAIDYTFATVETDMDLVYQATGNMSFDYPSRVRATNELGFLITSKGGSSATYLCDKMVVRMVQRSFRLCGLSTDTEIGMFALNTGDNSNKTGHISRMVYFKRSEE